jgi:hypothetical protein
MVRTVRKIPITYSLGVRTVRKHGITHLFGICHGIYNENYKDVCIKLIQFTQ